MPISQRPQAVAVRQSAEADFQVFGRAAWVGRRDQVRFRLAQRVEFREALGILAKRAGIEVNAPRGDDRSAKLRDEIRRVLTWARSVFRRNLETTPSGKRAVEYGTRPAR